MHLRPKTRRVLLISLCCIAGLLTACGIVLRREWPFTPSAVRSELGQAASAQVTFAHFQKKYFPPGCVAEGVVFQRHNSGKPLITIRRLTISSNLHGLLRGHVSLIHAEGMHVIAARSDFSAGGSSGHRIIDQLVANDAVLEIAQNSQTPTVFMFHRFVLKDLNGPGPTRFSAVFENPRPRGMLRVAGQFGPWNSHQPEATAIEGSYSLERADLGTFHFIAGEISASGKFNGTFQQLDVEGSTNTPEFEVTKTQHALPLTTQFSAAVDVRSGDVTLRSVHGRFGRDEIEAHGSIARGSDGKRIALIDITSERGRIEDTFYPFIHAPQSPVTGNVNFQLHIVIPSGPEAFLKKLDLQGNFHIRDARFTHGHTQEQVNKIASPHDEQDSHAPYSALDGTVTLRGGVAHFADLHMHDQGASASFRGNYNLVDERVDLHGQLKTDVSLTRATHGIRAVFAKIIEPFFKKKPHENVVPVKIGGTYDHPSFGLDLGKPS